MLARRSDPALRVDLQRPASVSTGTRRSVVGMSLTNKMASRVLGTRVVHPAVTGTGYQTLFGPGSWILRWSIRI